MNDNAPELPALQPLDIEENRAVGSVITVLTATDEDDGSNAALTYSIVNGDVLGKGLCERLICQYVKSLTN